MTIEIFELTIQDYDDAMALWESCSGLSKSAQINGAM